mgnify:FL=1
MNRKLRKNYYFSVEGETEKWYLKWLENQINNNDNALFKVNFTVYIQKDPIAAIKRITSVDNIEVIHVFDFEEPQNEEAFKNTLSSMKKATRMKKVRKYNLGYSNYSFDLWIILHKSNMRIKRTHRSDYLSDINRNFNTHFESMSKYKEETNFKRLLNSLTLDNVINAISNAEKIEQQNMRDYKKISHCGYEYYRENPSLSIHKCVKEILKTVGLL